MRGADLAGTFVFALQGALAALAGHLDLFGVMVLAFATALGGGVMRDVLMGALPPSALRGWSYPCTAFAAGVLVFAFEPYAHIPPELLLVLDAGGLALFAVAGTQKALDAGIHPLSAVLLGTITAVGAVRSGTCCSCTCRPFSESMCTRRPRCSVQSCWSPVGAWASPARRPPSSAGPPAWYCAS